MARYQRWMLAAAAAAALSGVSEASEEQNQQPEEGEPAPESIFDSIVEKLFGTGGEDCDGPNGCPHVTKHLRTLSAAASTSAGGYITSRANSRALSWTGTTRSIGAAISDAGWTSGLGHFHNGYRYVSAGDIEYFVNHDLMTTPPFNGQHEVLVPWPNQGDDQVGPGQYVGYSRRQVCYIVAKTLMGAGTSGYDNGLTRFMGTCARTGGFGKSLVTLLASCAADPTLQNGGQGPMVLVLRGKDPPSVAETRGVAARRNLGQANLRVCGYSDGVGDLPGVPQVPDAGCRPQQRWGTGRDFMTGGLENQAVIDISASWLGGYVLGNACGLGGGQDERLMVYFPEVAAMTFFLSASHPFPQLRQPAWILGARQFFKDLDGSARFNDYSLNKDVPLNSDLETITLRGQSYSISGSRPFLAFMSENQGYMNEDASNMAAARRNRHAGQRKVNSGDTAPFENQVRAWYGSTALSSYNEEVQPVLKQLVGSLGTGPWLAGLWWGDSQMGFLASWIGQALAAESWGGNLPLDYYIYSDFTENPGNQCYVHSHANCAACTSKCGRHPLPSSAFWMPGTAFFGGKSCADAGSSAYCGNKGIENVYATWGGRGALELWDHIQNSFRYDAHLGSTVFDVIM